MSFGNKCGAKEYLENYLLYYDKKSTSCKRWYTLLIGLDIIISAFIPFASLYIDTYPSAKYIIAFMGSLATTASAFIATFGFHKNWVEYRSTAEILRFHKYLFETRSAPYNGENTEELLISNVKDIFMIENKSWRSAELNNRKKASKNK